MLKKECDAYKKVLGMFVDAIDLWRKDDMFGDMIENSEVLYFYIYLSL